MRADSDNEDDDDAAPDEHVVQPTYLHRPGMTYPPPTCPTPLSTVNHTDFMKLMSLLKFMGPSRTVLAGFKSRWNKSEWMQSQRGYLERACLAAASGLPSGLSYCRCGLDYRDRFKRHRFQTCGNEYVCPSCNYHNKVEPCVREYLSAFDGKRFFYALTVSWQSSPKHAGMHWVTKQDAKGRATAWRHHRPFDKLAAAPLTYRYGSDDHAMLKLMAELPFKFAEALRKHDWFDGLYCVFEWDFAFYPAHDGHGCCHTCLPHMHVFANRSRPLTFEDGVEIQKLYQRTCVKHLGNELLPAYSDLEIAPIVSRDRLRGWINYQVKSMPIEKFYLEGVRHGCRLNALNLEFHQTIWDAIKLVHSPRKFGNLSARNKDEPIGYIGVQQFQKLTKSQHERLTKMVEDGQPLTVKETRQLAHHGLAVAQQKQYRAETKQRQDRAKLKRDELELKALHRPPPPQ